MLPLCNSTPSTATHTHFGYHHKGRLYKNITLITEKHEALLPHVQRVRTMAYDSAGYGKQS